MTASSVEINPRTIVSIDDNPSMLDLFRLILEPEGFKMAGAINGRDGLALIESTHPVVVLLDIMMPDMDGWQIFQTMRGSKTMAHIPVVMVTAKTQPIDRVLAEKVAKVNVYVFKPFDPAELIAAVRKALGE